MSSCSFPKLSLAGVGQARMGLRYPRGTRHAVRVYARDQHQSADLHGHRGVHGSAHQGWMQVMRGVGKTHRVDDGIDSARGRAGGSQVGQIRIEDLGVFEVAEGFLQFGSRAAHHAEGDATPLEFGGHWGTNSAGRAENRRFLNEGSHLRSPSIHRATIVTNPMPLNPGDRLGAYEIVGRLGAGAMGEVYRARDTRLERDVALKILPAEFAQNLDRRRRFELESRAASALNHPNIVSVFDAGEEQGVSYIVSELVDGDSLRDLIGRGPLPVRKALELALRASPMAWRRRMPRALSIAT